MSTVYEVGGKITLGSGEGALVATITQGVSQGSFKVDKWPLHADGAWCSVDMTDAFLACGAATYTPPQKAPEPIVETFDGFMNGSAVLYECPTGWSVRVERLGTNWRDLAGWNAHVVVTLTPPLIPSKEIS